MSADSFGPSPRGREYDLDTADANIKGDFNDACRGFIVLVQSTGSIVVTCASPFAGSATETWLVTNLIAGTKVPCQLTKINKGTTSGCKLLVFGG